MTATDVLSDAGYDFSDIEDAEDVTSTATGTSRGASASGGGTADDGSPSPRPRRGRRPAKTKLDTLQKKLSGQMFMIGTMGGAVLPVTGYYICAESDATTKAIVELAAKRPEWIEALENIAAIQPGLVLARASIGIGAAMAVDRKRAEPDTKFMQFIGVYSAWRAIEDKKAPGEPTDGTRYKPPPAPIQPVSVG